MSPKPLIPTDAEIEVVDRVWSGLAGLDAEVADLVPAKVQESLRYLSGVGAVLDSIRAEQPKRLEPHAEPLMAVLRGSGLGEEAAYDVISALFSSVAVARLLADVAVGNLDPVALVRKAKADTPVKKTAAKKAPAKSEEPPAVAQTRVEPVAAAEPAAAPAAAPVEPEASAPEEIVDESVDPNDFDLPVVEKPAPVAKKAAGRRPAAVPVSTSIGAGLVDADDNDDDF